MCDREENVIVLMEKEKNYYVGLRIRREGDVVMILWMVVKKKIYGDD